jgi:hypothetical protein
MKSKSTLLLAAFLSTSALATAQIVWDDFDNPEGILYDYYDGTDFQQSFANPDVSGVNTSALCAKYDRNAGVQFDVIVTDPLGGVNVDDVSDYVSGAKTMSVNVYSPSAGTTIQITLEDKNVAGPTNYPAGRHSEYLVTTTVAGQWETLTFSLSAQPDLAVSNATVNRLVLLFDPGSFSADTYYWDDLMGPEFSNPCVGVTPDPTILDDFECQRNISYAFSNGTLQSAPNPLVSGINTSVGCAKFTKYVPPTNDGAFGGPLSSPFTTAMYSTAHIQLYDPSAPKEFLIIFQDGGNSDVIQQTFTTTSTSTWEEFTIDLSSVSSATSIENVVLLFNPTSATEDTIFLDNFKLSNASSVESREFETTTTVYPVPFNNNIYVSSESEIAEVQVTDIAGKLVSTITEINNKNLTIDAADFAVGVYIITIQNIDGNLFSRKLMK